MTYIDTTYRDVSHIAAGKQGEGRFIFMASRQRLPLRTELEGDGPVPEGAVPVQVYRRDTGRRLGQFAADRGSLDDLRALLDQPRRLGMGCREEYPGLVGQLVVLVPASVVADLFGGIESPGEEEPWRQSLPEPPDLETGPETPELGGGPGAAGPASGGSLSGADEHGHEAGGGELSGAGTDPTSGGPADAGDGSGDDQMRFGALPLGNVVRFDEDREHPSEFVEEATDMFEDALNGDLPAVSERLMSTLAEEASVDE